jgi:hypothetical protein
MSLFDEASLIVTPNAYKEGKIFAIKPTDGSGDLSVVRATTATDVNSAGLIEDTPYNLASYSEQFNNVIWQKSNAVVTANDIIAPNGTLTADKLVLNGPFSAWRLNFVYQSGITYTLSFWGKKDGLGVVLNVRDNTNNVTYGTYNLTNDWVRYSFTFTPTTTSTLLYWGIKGAEATNDIIYIWGAQLVTGSSARDYFPTTDRLNVPRLDYTNSTCPSILVEPQRTNLALRSEEFNDASWLKQGATVTANTTVSPNGSMTADTISSSFGFSNFLTQSFVASVGQQFTYSFYILKTVNTTNGLYGGFSVEFRTAVASIAEYGATINSDAGSLISANGWGTSGFISSYVVDAGNYWRIVAVTPNAPATTTVVRVYHGVSGYFLNGTRINTGSSSKVIWGTQLEVGSNATSYIPTVASTVTRNADVISKTGISSLIGQTEGTIFAQIRVSRLLGTASRYIFHLSDGTTNNRIYMAFSGASSNILRARIFNGGVLQATIESSTITTLGTYKLALAYKNNDIVFYINGVQIGTDASATIPTCSRVDLGQNFANASQFNDGISNANIWKTRLTNAELAQLTTL